MKISFIYYLILLSFLSDFSFAKKKLPKKINYSQKIENSLVTIDYFQQINKKKKIWGKSIPFNKNWTFSSDSKTIISFDKDVFINNLRLLQGSYSFYIFPVNENDWHFIFNKNIKGSTKEYKMSDDVMRLSITPEKINNTDTLKIGIENIFTNVENKRMGDYSFEEEDLTYDLFVHFGELKAKLNIFYTEERFNMGLNPDLPDEIKPIWDIVMNSLQGLINEDFKMHTENFSKDFVTNWGDGGGTEGHIQMLGHFFRGGGLEGIGLNLENLTYTQENKNHIKFTNIVTHFPSNIYGHAFYFDYTLNKNENGKWEIVELIEPDHTPF